MAEQKIDAILLSGGTSLVYFTNIRWGGGERLLRLRHSVKGEPFFVCPAFEEDRAREQIARGPFERHADVAHLAGGREPVRAGRARPEGSRHRHRATRRRGDDEVRLGRQHRGAPRRS